MIHLSRHDCHNIQNENYSFYLQTVSYQEIGVHKNGKRKRNTKIQKEKSLHLSA